MIDPFGRVTTLTYDPKLLFVTEVSDPLGNTATADLDYRLLAPLTTSRKLAATFTDEPDWTPAAGSGTPSLLLAQAAPLLETETFSKAFAYDALGRITSATQPDLSELRPTYSDGGLLEAIDAKIRGASTWTPFVVGITYDANALQAGRIITSS